MRGLLCTALLLLGLALGEGSATRSLKLRPLPDLKACENTKAGRWFVADDQGLVCPRSDFDYSTGCCAAGAKHSCDTCDAEDSCCSGFEHCVSCCMDPRHEPDTRRERYPRGLNKPETGLWPSAFHYCQGVCRTTSRSTAHENSFIHDRRFCFSRLGRARVPGEGPAAPRLAPGVSVLLGGAGLSCAAACLEERRGCAVGSLAAVNDCNALREHALCEAGCWEVAPEEQHFPGYVVYGASKKLWPAACKTLGAPDGASGGAAGPPFNCTAAAEGVQRLCACEVVPLETLGLTDDGGTAAEGEAAQEGQQQEEQQEVPQGDENNATRLGEAAASGSAAQQQASGDQLGEEQQQPARDASADEK